MNTCKANTQQRKATAANMSALDPNVRHMWWVYMSITNMYVSVPVEEKIKALEAAAKPGKFVVS